VEISLGVKELYLVLIGKGIDASISVRSHLGQLSLILMCYL
jgi:hypothetical protein